MLFRRVTRSALLVTIGVIVVAVSMFSLAPDRFSLSSVFSGIPSLSPSRFLATVPSTCGNGVLEPGEACDTGFTYEMPPWNEKIPPCPGRDECHSDCTCGTIPRLSSSSSSMPQCVPPSQLPDCGNGVIECPESCDDGMRPALVGVGCGLYCELEYGWVCLGEPSVCTPLCGNGYVDPDEECDDGNLLNGDGCTAFVRQSYYDSLPGCKIEKHWTCTMGANGKSTCTRAAPLCGNGVVDYGEQCDGPLDSAIENYHCCVNCRIEPRSSYDAVCPSPLDTCGDGTRNLFNEDCDDGNAINGDGCSATCTVEFGWQCGGTVPSACSRVTIPSKCGDGIGDAGEACDRAGQNSNMRDAYCRPDCRRARCGDGIRDTGETGKGWPISTPKNEECDDGNTIDDDQCSNTCTVVAKPSPYGNGVVNPEHGEECDDGNFRDNDACDSTFHISRCGDGRVNGSDQCDTGVLSDTDDDGCSSACRFDGSGCGNGTLQADEMCDDGNQNDFDGCSPYCEAEQGFLCFAAATPGCDINRDNGCCRLPPGQGWRQVVRTNGLSALDATPVLSWMANVPHPDGTSDRDGNMAIVGVVPDAAGDNLSWKLNYGFTDLADWGNWDRLSSQYQGWPILRTYSPVSGNWAWRTYSADDAVVVRGPDQKLWIIADQREPNYTPNTQRPPDYVYKLLKPASPQTIPSDLPTAGNPKLGYYSESSLPVSYCRAPVAWSTGDALWLYGCKDAVTQKDSDLIYSTSNGLDWSSGGHFVTDIPPCPVLSTTYDGKLLALVGQKLFASADGAHWIGKAAPPLTSVYGLAALGGKLWAFGSGGAGAYWTINGDQWTPDAAAAPSAGQLFYQNALACYARRLWSLNGSRMYVLGGFSGMCETDPEASDPSRRRCGDGVKNGSEECDDWNTRNGDGCSSTCRIESGWKCTGATSVCCNNATASCGEACSYTDGDWQCVAYDNGTTIAPFDQLYGSCIARTKTPFARPLTGLVEHLEPPYNVWRSTLKYTLTVSNNYDNATPYTVKVRNWTSDENVTFTHHQLQYLASRSSPECSWTASTLEVTCAANVPARQQKVFTLYFKTQPETPCVHPGHIRADLYLSGAHMGEVLNTSQGRGVTLNCTDCGNGRVDTGEGCDDGNGIAGDGCNWCGREEGWQCSGNPSVCRRIGSSSSNPGFVSSPASSVSSSAFDTSCTDTDGGRNYVEAGTARGASVASSGLDTVRTYADNCVSATRLVEGYCPASTGWPVTETITCPGLCAAGACIAIGSSSSHFSSAASVMAFFCGNRAIELGEECDDGNISSGDGCSGACQREPGWVCQGVPSVCSTLCGDGIRAGIEQCDDSNTVSGDGCSRTCQIEYSTSSSAYSFYYSVASSYGAQVCGNGILEGSEQCEITSGCLGSAICQSCRCVDTQRCGDGRVEYPEQCDVNYPCANGGFCTVSCTCTPRASSASSQSASLARGCGNRVLDEGEECEVNVLCPQSGSVCVNCFCRTASALCGNSVLEDNEECEANLPCPGTDICQDCQCFAQTFHEALSPVSSAPLTTTVTPQQQQQMQQTAALCGNGFLELGEQCEAHRPCPRPGDQCFNCECHNPPASVCGNFLIETGEGCDDGNTVSGDGCSHTCQREIPTMIAAQNICGNGLIEQGEECDDGNTVSGDGCSAVCILEHIDFGSGSEPYSSLTLLPSALQSSSLRTGPIPKKAPEFPAVSVTPPTPVPTPPVRPVAPVVSVPVPAPVVTPVPVPAYAPWQYPYAATLVPYAAPVGPVGQTGPASVVLMAAGAAAGFAWMRRKKR